MFYNVNLQLTDHCYKKQNNRSNSCYFLNTGKTFITRRTLRLEAPQDLSYRLIFKRFRSTHVARNKYDDLRRAETRQCGPPEIIFRG